MTSGEGGWYQDSRDITDTFIIVARRVESASQRVIMMNTQAMIARLVDGFEIFKMFQSQGKGKGSGWTQIFDVCIMCCVEIITIEIRIDEIKSIQ